MERLTYWNREAARWYSHGTIGEIIDRLAAYENAMPLQRAQELAQAEKDERLVVLPCKIGDVIYMPVGRCGITGFEEDRCDGYYINREGILQIKAECHSGNHGTYGVTGKTVFLTREEAEAALKKREAENETD